MAGAQMNLLGVDLFGGEPQWRLARVELANWGTFGGFTRMDVSAEGLLVTGESGSGKSTLLDAIATVLTPPRARRFNAAARGDGIRDDRTIVSYVRGAWGHEDDSGEVTSAYLRPKTATWSGVLLTFRSVDVRPVEGSGAPELLPNEATEPVQLLALFNLKAGSNDRQGLSTLYGIVRGDHTLPEFQTYALNGIAKKRFKQEVPGALCFDRHATFSARFRQLLGIGSDKTLELLHKTQGAKNFGSLDELFRNFMLDEPESFTYARQAVEKFRELSDAHTRVADQRHQMETLAPLVAIDESVRSLRERAAENQSLRDLLTPATDRLIAESMDAEIARLERRRDRREQAVRVAEAELEREREALEQAEALVRREGGLAIAEAEREANRLEELVRDAERNRQSLRRELAALEISATPESLDDWRGLVRSLEEDARRALEDERAHRDENRRIQARAVELRDRLAAIEEELDHLRRQPSNIPRTYDAIRTAIAEFVGARSSDLPFVGELMDVPDEFAQWRGAFERLFGRSSLTLLVPLALTRSVTAFVDRRNLKTRFEFVSVPPDLEAVPRCRDRRLVAGRVEVRDVPHHPEFARWVRADLAKRWDYVCVEGPGELQRYGRALTINGQVKRGDRYIKDDRHAIDDRTHWLLGSDNAEKLEGYERDRSRLLLEAERSLRKAEAVEQSQRDTQALVLASKSLAERSWDAYDVAGRERALEAARERIRTLQEGNEGLGMATARWDEAKRSVREAQDRLTDARVTFEGTCRELSKNLEDRQKVRRKIEESTDVPDETLERLRGRFAEADEAYGESVERIYRTYQSVMQDLVDEGTRIEREETRGRMAASRAMQEYRQGWPALAADFSVEFEDIDAYLAIYRQIRATGLPEYEDQFLKLLQDFNRDSITRLSSAIRNAPSEIENKLEPVNESLGRSFYAPGTHLAISMIVSRGSVAQQFLTDLRDISSGALRRGDIDESESRFKRADDIIRRLGSEDPEDRRWRRICLDTRQHVRFIAREIGEDGQVKQVYESDAGLSGGQKQKLVIFCLAAALRYQLADESRFLPRYATVILDEAFDKADSHFAASALEIFEAFGFHLLLATPLRHIGVIEDHVGGATYVHCEDRRRSTLRPVSFDELERLEAEAADIAFLPSDASGGADGKGV